MKIKQYYSLSKTIFQEVTKAKSILLNAHRNPDLDSIGSSTVMMKVLQEMGKKVKLICPTKVSKDFLFIKKASEIKAVDFSGFDFRPYDLFLILDSGSYDVVTGNKGTQLPKIKKIVIDHHRSNNFTDVKLKLYEENAAATCEMVYKLLSDWNIKIDQDMATALFSGIAGDTVFFRYTDNTKETFKIIGELIEKGADKDFLVEKMFNNYEFSSVQLVGEFLAKMKKENDFVWSAIDYRTFEKFGKPKGIRELTADLFFQSIKDSKFGIAILEEEKNKLFVSLRSIKNTDVSKLAQRIGGGGHRNAAGATVYGSYPLTLKKIINTIKNRY